MAGNAGAIDSQTPRTASLPALFGLAGVIVLPLLPVGKWVAPGDSMRALMIRESVWWFYAAAVVAWLHFAERLPLSTIGLRRPTWKSLLFAFMGAVALLAVFVLHFAVVVPMFHLNANPAIAVRNLVLARPFWYRLLLVLRAAVVEEILFRGYMIEKVRQLTGSTLLAITVSVATFTYAHMSGWGLVQLIPVFGAGVILALLYVWKRDLPCNMMAHFLTDGASFLLH